LFLMAVMNDQEAGARVRIEAARALMPYQHAKKGDGGKKEEQRAAAQKASRGRFAPATTPKLLLVHKR